MHDRVPHEYVAEAGTEAECFAHGYRVYINTSTAAIEETWRRDI